MDKSSIIGVVLGLIAIGVGMVMKGVAITALINPAAILIIILGTAAAVIIAFPMKTLKKVPVLFKVLFKEQETKDIKETIDRFIEWSEVTRQEGLLALEQRVKDIDDSFLQSGLQLAIDGQPPDFIEQVMIEKVSAMEERHAKGAKVFTQAGTYAPTLGVLGAVVGLVAALGDMEDMEKLGHAISAAFIATLLGIFTGYVLWHPFANKLKEKSSDEAQIKYIVIEGILSLVNGDSPRLIKDKLYSYLSESEIDQLEEEGGDNA